MLRFDALEASIASIHADLNYVRHLISDNLSDWRMFKTELFRRLDETRQICTTMEKRLHNMGKNDNSSMESNIKQTLTTSVQSLAIGEGTTVSGHKKRLYAETEFVCHSAPTKGGVSTKNEYFSYLFHPLEAL